TELMDGSISVTIAEGCGSIFTVRLPVALPPTAFSRTPGFMQAQRQTTSQPLQAVPVGLFGKRILFVSPLTGCRRIMEKYLTGWGGIVKATTSAKEAAEYLR